MRLQEMIVHDLQQQLPTARVEVLRRDLNRLKNSAIHVEKELCGFDLTDQHGSLQGEKPDGVLHEGHLEGGVVKLQGREHVSHAAENLPVGCVTHTNHFDRR